MSSALCLRLTTLILGAQQHSLRCVDIASLQKLYIIAGDLHCVVGCIENRLCL